MCYYPKHEYRNPAMVEAVEAALRLEVESGKTNAGNPVWGHSIYSILSFSVGSEQIHLVFSPDGCRHRKTASDVRTLATAVSSKQKSAPPLQLVEVVVHAQALREETGLGARSIRSGTRRSPRCIHESKSSAQMLFVSIATNTQQH